MGATKQRPIYRRIAMDGVGFFRVNQQQRRFRSQINHTYAMFVRSIPIQMCK